MSIFGTSALWGNTIGAKQPTPRSRADLMFQALNQACIQAFSGNPIIYVPTGQPAGEEQAYSVAGIISSKHPDQEEYGTYVELFFDSASNLAFSPAKGDIFQLDDGSTYVVRDLATDDAGGIHLLGHLKSRDPYS